jgi:hypothetical protein
VGALGFGHVGYVAAINTGTGRIAVSNTGRITAVKV